MDIQNHYYGHSAVLAAYAGLPRPRHIAGLLQHGWTATSPVPAHFADFPKVGTDPRQRRLLVWSHDCRGWSPTDEDRTTTAIGAPLLYLERLLRRGGWESSAQLGPVFIPFHGTRLVRVTGAHADLARQVAKVDGPSTVCLHHEDMTDPEITTAWAEAGHTLVTAGRRDDPHFLLRIMHLIGHASRVSSNRLSTAVLYAAAIGTPAAVWGDPLTFGHQGAEALAMLRDRWPEFHVSDPADGSRPVTGAAEADAAATELARRELGAHHLLEPDVLRDALGWGRTPSIGPGLQYYAASPVNKAAMVLGLTKRSEASQNAMTAGGFVSFSPMLWLKNPLAAVPRPLPKGLPVPIATEQPLDA
ncbi:hypothetical protein AD006_04885 [Pseudonocardia sp. EC080610-09]|uniref:hypothetical protein n=1 Tax=unclassified Pseudonocardia TaxID=2619320 RepID=UPI00070598B0|nr:MULTISPECIES: hypothetical protein [unclassified Pseudonocardia]ALL74805.1 hypothetical protein AD006_04885 [Pseudonocardia sp. EC080610-09]ALL81828.1 hypothetical protein AD017_12705 [Pseudonocardia sp. EC080619-01]